MIKFANKSTKKVTLVPRVGEYYRKEMLAFSQPKNIHVVKTIYLTKFFGFINLSHVTIKTFSSS